VQVVLVDGLVAVQQRARARERLAAAPDAFPKLGAVG
jgi:hypothetical protein